MNSDGKESLKEIVELLKKHPEGLSIHEISAELGVHRHTVAKYIYFLEGSGEVFVRKIGAVSLIYHNKLRPREGRK
jgi:response regulator of citrate/malate metabolism